jgi:hypothetical protein
LPGTAEPILHPVVAWRLGDDGAARLILSAWASYDGAVVMTPDGSVVQHGMVTHASVAAWIAEVHEEAKPRKTKRPKPAPIDFRPTPRSRFAIVVALLRCAGG